MPSNRSVEVTTPLGADALLFKSMSVSEELGRMYEIQLDLLSPGHEVNAEKLIGHNFAVRIETLDGHERFFNGVCSRFAYVGEYLHYVQYTATLRPWLWLLTRTSDCRIFQEKSVPEIIEEVFREHGLTEFKDSLTGSYSPRDYCVQYRESDCNFVSRLMEEEGIYYFFEHGQAGHKLVLADSYGAHSKGPYDTIPYFPPDLSDRRKSEHMQDVTLSECLQPGSYVVESFDFEKPRAELKASAAAARSHAHADFEVFDYPAHYTASGDGQAYARARLDEYSAQYKTLMAEGDPCALGAGMLFSLTDHPREELNGEYLIVGSSHEVELGGYESGTAGNVGVAEDSIRIRAIPSDQQFRSICATPTPVIQGPQTAIVVGKKGEEIWTDQHGRVKVQFHWDREGKLDENSSCWIRVAQPWAGKGWGAMMLPRIGQEVIVEFLGGDPDRPIVTGSVYNGDNKVPYSLPANQTQSGVLTRSTKSGAAADFNELRFEDKKGQEQVYFHAQKDFERVVEENDTLTVEKGDRSVEISMGSDSLLISQGDRKTEVKLGKSTTEAMKSIELKVGQSLIKIDQQGVTIKGMMIKIEGTAMSEMKAPMTTIKGDGMLTAKGGITMIN